MRTVTEHDVHRHDVAPRELPQRRRELGQVIERVGDRPEHLRLRQHIERDLRNDSEYALRADEKPGQVRPSTACGDVLVARVYDLACRKHYLHVPDDVASGAVLVRSDAGAACTYPPAQGGGGSAAGVARQEQPFCVERLAERLPRHPSLDRDNEVLLVDGHDLVHGGHVEDVTTLDRNRTAEPPGARSTRNDGLLGGDGLRHHLRYLMGVLWPDDLVRSRLEYQVHLLRERREVVAVEPSFELVVRCLHCEHLLGGDCEAGVPARRKGGKRSFPIKPTPRRSLTRRAAA